LHHSFGDDQSQEGFQWPHLVAPIHRGMDRIIVTPPGESIPTMGVPWYDLESTENRKIRVNGKKSLKPDLTSTFSFSVNTNNVDLPSWSLVGLPMVKKVPMTSILAGGKIRLVAYELVPAAPGESSSKHPNNRLKYVFNLSMDQADPSQQTRVAMSIDDDGDDDDNGFETGYEAEPVSPASPTSPNRRRLATEDSNESSPGDSEPFTEWEITNTGSAEDNTFEVEYDGTGPDATRESRVAGARRRLSAIGAQLGSKLKSGVGRLKEKVRSGPEGDDQGFLKSRVNWLSNRIRPQTAYDQKEVLETLEVHPTDFNFERSGGLFYCPACVEIYPEGRRRLLFMLHYNSAGLSTGSAPSSPSSLSSKAKQGNGNGTDTKSDYPLVARFRSYEEIQEEMPLELLPRQTRNRRLSVHERMRRQVVLSYKAALENSSTHKALTSFLARENMTDISILGSLGSLLTVQSKQGVLKWEGSVFHVLSARYWSEDHLVLSKEQGQLIVQKRPESKRSAIVVPVSSILGVKPVRQAERPTDCLFFFQVETFARVYYFIVKTEELLKSWMEAFASVIGERYVTGAEARDQTLPPNYLSVPFEPLWPGDAYLAKPIELRIEHRSSRVFNYRCIKFRTPGLSLDGLVQDDAEIINPVHLVESVLSKVFVLAESHGVADAILWIDFMDTLSLLQIVELSRVSENERAAILINLYHVMVLHGQLVLGAATWTTWNSFFDTVSYFFSFDFISSAELEHNVLRACMSRPLLGATNTMTVPHSFFPDLALQSGDFRLNFAINNGSKTMMPGTVVFNAEDLDSQLDATAAQFILSTVEFDHAKRVVLLPRIFSWYAQDFKQSNKEATADFASVNGGFEGEMATTSGISNSLSGSSHGNSSSSSKSNTGEFSSSSGTLSAGKKDHEMLFSIVHYMRGQNREALIRMLTDGGPIFVKYRKYNYRCSSFTRNLDLKGLSPGSGSGKTAETVE
jgi:hypothetical protein